MWQDVFLAYPWLRSSLIANAARRFIRHTYRYMPAHLIRRDQVLRPLRRVRIAHRWLRPFRHDQTRRLFLRWGRGLDFSKRFPIGSTDRVCGVVINKAHVSANPSRRRNHALFEPCSTCFLWSFQAKEKMEQLPIPMFGDNLGAG